MRLSFEEIVRAVDGSAVAGAAPCGIVEGVGTDSRAVKPGSLFVCIPGETFDGARFCGQGRRSRGRRAAGIPESVRCRAARSAHPC